MRYACALEGLPVLCSASATCRGEAGGFVRSGSLYSTPGPLRATYDPQGSSAAGTY